MKDALGGLIGRDMNPQGVAITVLAEASRKVMPRSDAKALPVSVWTTRAFSKSVLLPTSIIVISCVAFSFSSPSHFSTFENDVSFVMSYTTRAPTAVEKCRKAGTKQADIGRNA